MYAHSKFLIKNFGLQISGNSFFSFSDEANWSGHVAGNRRVFDHQTINLKESSQLVALLSFATSMPQWSTRLYLQPIFNDKLCNSSRRDVHDETSLIRCQVEISNKFMNLHGS